MVVVMDAMVMTDTMVMVVNTMVMMADTVVMMADTVVMVVANTVMVVMMNPVMGPVPVATRSAPPSPRHRSRIFLYMIKFVSESRPCDRAYMFDHS